MESTYPPVCILDPCRNSGDIDITDLSVHDALVCISLVDNDLLGGNWIVSVVSYCTMVTVSSLPQVYLPQSYAKSLVCSSTMTCATQMVSMNIGTMV